MNRHKIETWLLIVAILVSSVVTFYAGVHYQRKESDKEKSQRKVEFFTALSSYWIEGDTIYSEYYSPIPLTDVASTLEAAVEIISLRDVQLHDALPVDPCRWLFVNDLMDFGDTDNYRVMENVGYKQYEDITIPDNRIAGLIVWDEDEYKYVYKAL